MTTKDSKMSGNKGEWSELYAFMKLLSQGRCILSNSQDNERGNKGRDY